MYMSRHQTTGQNHYLKVANRTFENVAYSNVGAIRPQIKLAFAMKLRTD
jgi:hypothetical protein